MLLRALWLGTYVQTEHDDRDDVVGRGDIPIVHDQTLTVSEARVGVDVGLSRRWAASVVVPVRLVSTTIRYFDTDGMPVELVQPGIHHRDETLVGLADPMVLGATSARLGPLRLTARAGATIPLGRTESDPFANEDIPHEHIQMGTGTVNPVLAVDGAWARGPWRVGGFLFTQQVVYENGKGYHAGDRYAAVASARRQLGAFGVRGGLELQAETGERWQGIAHDEGNRGRLDALAVAGGSWAVGGGWALDLTVKVPFVTHVVGGQLDMPAIVEAGASWSFGGRPAHVHDEHEHEHEHEHDAHPVAVHPDATGLDVADAGAPGEAVDLVPVPGKLTIFDFWAAWCEPCKTLEPVLVDLVRDHPGAVALRRVDVVDWDSKAAARYLTPGGYNLPHLKIYDARGALIVERTPATGQLAALIDEVRRLVDAASAKPAAPNAVPPKPAGASEKADVVPPKPAGASPKADVAPPKPAPRPAAALRVDITADDKGYAPAVVKVPHGRPVTLRFTRTAAKTCATEVVLVHDGKTIVKALPLGTAVELTLVFAKPGPVTYACAMNMMHGTIDVQ